MKATTVRQIAERAGVSAALVIHHFTSKDRLRLACDRFVAAHILERKAAVMRTGGGLDPLAVLREHAGDPPIRPYLARTLAEGTPEGTPEVASLVDEMIDDAERTVRDTAREAGRERRPGGGIMNVVIEVSGLVKDYGRTRALDGLDLEVRSGEVFGFIGPNGAGKSTTIRVLMDLLRPTAGVARVFGVTPAAGGPALRARIGYLPGELAMGGRVSAGAHLHHFASLRGGRGRDAIDSLAERFRLDLARPVRTLSKGNKQKVGVIQAFMHEPELLILDEPTSGLDPLLQHEFLALVREAASRGATVLMSSHVLREVESVADRVAVIRQGRTVDVDSVVGLRHRAGQRVNLRFAEEPDASEAAAIGGVEQVRVEEHTLTCLLRGEPDELLKWAARTHVVAWSARDLDLEDLFLDVYRNHGVADDAEGTTDAR